MRAIAPHFYTHSVRGLTLTLDKMSIRGRHRRARQSKKVPSWLIYFLGIIKFYKGFGSANYMNADLF